MKPLRVYFAGAFARRGELRDLVRELTAGGQVVSTASWLAPGTQLDDDAHLSEEVLAVWALRNLGDIGSSELLVALAERPESPHRRGGRHAEVGAALALQRPVYLWGAPEHVFHRHPLCWTYSDRTELVAAVLRYATCPAVRVERRWLPAPPAGGQSSAPRTGIRPCPPSLRLPLPIT